MKQVLTFFLILSSLICISQDNNTYPNTEPYRIMQSWNISPKTIKDKKIKQVIVYFHDYYTHPDLLSKFYMYFNSEGILDSNILEDFVYFNTYIRDFDSYRKEKPVYDSLGIDYDKNNF